MEQHNAATQPVTVTEHLWIPMPDGTRLSARLWLPESAAIDPVPAVLEYIPYRKRDMVRARDERNHPYIAAHGYACLRIDMRGSGDSQGIMTDMYGDHELNDVIDAIDWIAAQPWCDGQVGMFGTSWGGTASLQAASRRPDALKAVIAVAAVCNRFDDDIHHMGGCLLTDSIEWGATLPAILASPPDPETVGEQWRSMWMQRLENLSFPLEAWVRHETRDSYWRHGSVNETPGAIACPTLAIAGWVDRYSNNVMQFLSQNPNNSWGIIGPWGHHYPDVAEPGPGTGFQQLAVQWWDRWLKGKENGIDRMPKLQAWMQDYDTPQDRLEIRQGRWVSTADWPSETVETKTFYPSLGELRDSPSNTAEDAVVPWTLKIGDTAGDTGYFGRPGGLPGDQSGEDTHALTFETSPFQEDLEILGTVSLETGVSLSSPITVLVGRLVDVPPNGAPARVSTAVTNLNLVDENGVERADGEPQNRRVNLVFTSTGYRIAKGHRLRLSLSTSYWPWVWPAPHASDITLHLKGAQLKLPLYQPNNAMEKNAAAPALPEPISTSFERNYTTTAAPELVRSTERNDATGERRISWHQPLTKMKFHDIDLEFGYETRAEHLIRTDDPNSARSSFEHHLRYHRSDADIHVTGCAEVTATETHYQLNGSVKVEENGEVIFERNWSPTVQRRSS